MIKAQDVTKRYGETEAVRDTSFSIGQGEILGLLGPNGAGKTTLMKIVTCYHFPDSGTVTIDGYSVFDFPDKIKEIIGYLPENAPVYTDLNVFEYLDFICDARHIPGNQKKQRMERAVEICGLTSVVYKPIEQLSKGFKQRVGLAQAIIHDPAILILDEPTAGLDPNQIVEIRKLILDLGKEKTVILSTHILREVEILCNRVLIMNKGSIAARGTTEEISGQLEGGSVLFVKCKGENVSGFPQRLLGSKFIKKILFSENTNGFLELQCSAASRDEGLEEIFDAAVQHNIKIIELHPVATSLEDIFIKLTGKEAV